MQCVIWDKSDNSTSLPDLSVNNNMHMRFVQLDDLLKFNGDYEQFQYLIDIFDGRIHNN